MSRKLHHLARFVVVLGLVAIPALADIDDGLIAYWPLDEGAGDSAADITGNGSDGTLNGGPTWVEGKLGGALDFDGSDDYVDCGNPPILDHSTNDFTISAWVKTDDPGGDNLVYSKGGDSGGGIRYELMFRDNNGGDARLLVDDDSTKYDPDTDDKQLSDGQWHHLVAMRRNGTELRMYVDGVEDQGLTDHGESTIPADYDLSGTTQHNAHIGANYHHGNNEVQKFFTGMIDDVAIWNRALTEEEIAYLYNNGDGNPVDVAAPGQASGQSPAHEALDVSRDLALTWVPGEFAATHNVYIGEAFDDVNDSTVPTVAGLDVNSFDPGRLEFGKTYYWRVDEVNGTPDQTVYRGIVWSFEVEPHSILIPGATITATASSSSNELSTPERTIDRSGLGEDDSHSMTTEEMWFTGNPDLDPWIQYEFDEVKKLDIMKVWNSNGAAESGIGWGVKDVVIEYSVDGENWDVLADANQFTRAPGSSDYAAPDIVDFAGAAAKVVRLNIQSNWGGILMSYSLSEVQFYMIPATARTPDPASGTVDVLPDGAVTWRAGRGAAEHTIYIGTDPNEVAGGLAPTVTTSTNRLDLGSLDLALSQTYYWRVDEVNSTEATTTWAGPVWNFTVVDALTVEDFEAYGNVSPDRPFQTWLDGFGYSADDFFPVAYAGNGTGSGVGHDIWSISSPHYGGDIMETDNTIAGSRLAMPLYYDNTGNVSSETQRTFQPPQDWTVGSVQTLSIAFSGQAGNTGTLYVKINNTKIPYPWDAGNLAIGAWQVWNIDLADVGGNLSSISSMSIGVDGAGASGMLLIDDMKLYALPGEVITPVAPGNDGLLAQYSFEGNANDSSGSGLNGQLTGSQVGQPGAPNHGSAVHISPGGFVDLGNPSVLDFGTGDWTLGAWFKTGMTGTGDDNKGTVLAKGGDTGGGHRYALIMSETSEGVVSLVTDDDVTKYVVDATSVTNDDQWHYVVGQREGNELRIYIDGQLEGSATADPGYDLSGTSQHNAYIGAVTNNGSGTLYKLLNGSVDEVVIYTRALSDEEILWLAGRTSPVQKPF